MSAVTISATDMAGNETVEHEDNSMWVFTTYMDQISELPVDIVKVVTILYYSTGVLANTLLLIYLIKFKRYQSPTFMLITSLAGCDLGTCFSGLLLTSMTMPYVIGPSWLCTFCIYTAVAFYDASILHVIFFSILRFMQLVYPLKSRATITPGLVLKICLVCWTIPLGSSIMPMAYYVPTEYYYRGKRLVSCVFIEKYADYLVGLEIIMLIVSNLIITGFHIAKHIMVKKQSKKDISTTEEQEKKRQTTDARAITLVIAMFCITSQPQVWHTLIHFIFGVPIGEYHMLIYAVTVNMEFGNSAMNPFIYMLCARSVRQDIVKMFRKDKS